MKAQAIMGCFDVQSSLLRKGLKSASKERPALPKTLGADEFTPASRKQQDINLGTCPGAPEYTGSNCTGVL